MAIPVHIAVTLTSSLSIPVSLAMDGTNQIDTSGDVEPNGNLPSWAEPVDTNMDCQDEGLTWSNLASGQTVSWNGWLMDPDTITPDDPTGSSARTEIFLLPDVELGSGDADFTPNFVASHNLVDCAEVTPGPEIAVDVSLALSLGCTAYTGN